MGKVVRIPEQRPEVVVMMVMVLVLVMVVIRF
jgi:hypothetical protein